jgi:predicted ester cyclase
LGQRSGKSPEPEQRSRFARDRGHGRPPEIPATGNKVDFTFVGVFRVENGKISSIRLYYDQIEVFAQLGLMPGATSS